MSSPQEQKIQDQIKEQFQKAFYDTIKHSIQNKNHDHIIRLYVEIQDRLAIMLKKDGPTHQPIETTVAFNGNINHWATSNVREDERIKEFWSGPQI